MKYLPINFQLKWPSCRKEYTKTGLQSPYSPIMSLSTLHREFATRSCKHGRSHACANGAVDSLRLFGRHNLCNFDQTGSCPTQQRSKWIRTATGPSLSGPSMCSQGYGPNSQKVDNISPI